MRYVTAVTNHQRHSISAMLCIPSEEQEWTITFPSDSVVLPRHSVITSWPAIANLINDQALRCFFRASLNIKTILPSKVNDPLVSHWDSRSLYSLKVGAHLTASDVTQHSSHIIRLSWQVRQSSAPDVTDDDSDSDEAQDSERCRRAEHELAVGLPLACGHARHGHDEELTKEHRQGDNRGDPVPGEEKREKCGDWQGVLAQDDGGFREGIAGLQVHVGG